MKFVLSHKHIKQKHKTQDRVVVVKKGPAFSIANSDEAKTKQRYI